MKSVASGWGWLIHGQSSLNFSSGSICFPETNQPEGCYPSAWQRGSLPVVMTSAVLSAARRLFSTCRTGILPRWSRHQMSRELCTCSFWKRRLTSCFSKSCGLTRLVCFRIAFAHLGTWQDLANTAPGNRAWRFCVCHPVCRFGCSFATDGVEDNIQNAYSFVENQCQLLKLFWTGKHL